MAFKFLRLLFLCGNFIACNVNYAAIQAYAGAGVGSSDKILVERYENWQHPVLEPFKKFGITPYKVSYSIDGTFPTFYANFKYSPDPRAPDAESFHKVYFEALKANSYFPYAIVDEKDGMRINVGWEDRVKKIMKVDLGKATPVGNAEANKDIVYVDRMLISTSATPIRVTDPVTQLKSDKVIQGNDSIERITSKDKIIYYVANIGVINPAKKYYHVKIICVDSNGNTVITGKVKRLLSGFSYQVGGETIKGYEQTLGLDPKPGAMIKGQLIPLESGHDYFIKLFVENKLVGLTKFNYEVIPVIE